MIKIYKITNHKNGKLYFGITKQELNDRFNQHYYKKTSHISTAMRKYGRENFSIELIDETDTKEKAGKIEKTLIEEYNTRDRKIGYNKQKGGQYTEPDKHPNRIGMLGKKHTNESKKLMSINHADVSKEKNPFYGKNHSNETKKKISNSNKGIKRTNEFKKQRSERYLGKNNPNSKVIILYNNKDEIIDIIEGGIRSYLKDNKLPPSLEKTYRHNTTIKNGDYVGWYCRIKEKNGL